MQFASFVTEMDVVVSCDDLSPLGYVEDTAYLRWVQAVVIKHWERFAPEAARASTLWIAVKHKISLHSPGGSDDALVARTRIDRLKGVRAVFTTIFCKGHKLLAEVESTWVSLDATTKLPKQLEKHVITAFQEG